MTKEYYEGNYEGILRSGGWGAETCCVNTWKIYEGGYLRNPLRVGYLNSTPCLFLPTEPILMFLGVLERGGHARSSKKKS